MMTRKQKRPDNINQIALKQRRFQDNHKIKVDFKGVKFVKPSMKHLR